MKCLKIGVLIQFRFYYTETPLLMLPVFHTVACIEKLHELTLK